MSASYPRTENNNYTKVQEQTIEQIGTQIQQYVGSFENQDKVTHWNTKTTGPLVEPNNPNNKGRSFQRSFPQLNMKAVEGNRKGEHIWHDITTGRSGWTPPEAEARGKPYIPSNPSSAGPKLK